MRMRDVRMSICIVGLAALMLSGFGCLASAGQAAQSPVASTALRLLPVGLVRPPTPADFVAYPSCMIYLAEADTRIRVRAARASAVCATLSKQLSSSGLRWLLKPRRPRRILSPICRFADPSSQLELEVIDAATNSARGRRICANLTRAGWFDLSHP
jgi:hypothetical protein